MPRQFFRLQSILLVIFFGISCSVKLPSVSSNEESETPDTSSTGSTDISEPAKTIKPLAPLDHISPAELTSLNDAERIKLQLRDRSFSANLPTSGTLSLADIKNLSLDPISFTQCGDYGATDKFQELSDELGGFRYQYRLRSESNHRDPIFVKEFVKFNYPSASSFDESADMATKAESAQEFAVEIKRADLIGRFGDRVLYLSKVYGLFFVKLEASGPKLSCYLLQPGQAKNFYIHDDSVVLLINGIYPKNNAAIVRYKIEESGLAYRDHHILKLQHIKDSRLFNDSLAIFATIKEEVKQAPVSALGRTSEPMIAEPMIDSAISRPYAPVSDNSMLTVLDLKSNMDVTFEDIFIDQEELPIKPFPVSKEHIGKVNWRNSHYNHFISASDKYLVISRTVNKRKITGIKDSSYTNWECTNYQPQWKKHTYSHCKSIWEDVPNPDYDPNFSCSESKSFFSCLLENENKFIKSTSVFKGNKCEEREYWRGKCLSRKYTSINRQHFTYKWETSSEMVIYRFTPQGFTRIGDPETEDVLTVDGFAKEHKSFYFKNDHFYVLTTTNQNDGFWGGNSNETVLHTFAVGKKTLVKTHRLGGLGLGERLRAVLFEDKALYLVTYRAIDPLYGIDLSVPHIPRLASDLKIPGFSTQLILHNDKLIGLGRGDKEGREGRTSHVKLSLFDVGSLDNIFELDNTLLGEEKDNSYNNVQQDDQLFHFQRSESRLFMPYQTSEYKKLSYDDAYICRKNSYSRQHRISISSFAEGKIKLDADFAVPVNIKRQLATDENSALAFGETAVYSLKKEDSNWSIATVREEYTLESVYRDPSLPEGMIVGKMVKNNSNSLSHLKFVMGTPEEIWSNKAQFTMEVPQAMVECLGRPTIRFLDNNVVAVFRTYSNSGIQSSPVEYVFAWSFTAEGITELAKEEAVKLSEEKRKVCAIKGGIVIDDGISLEKFDELFAKVKPEDLECRTDYYINRPIFCDYKELSVYCPIARPLPFGSIQKVY